jgi:NAD(P)-dependent dehydrogenase (short-subunit alcohol dehydrogenase family)
MTGRLESKTAVVIGVGSTIGRSVALTFANEGARVLAVDPDGAVAGDVAKTIVDSGGAATAFAAAFWGDDAAEAVARRCEGLFGSLDVLFNCSAVEDHWVWGDAEDTIENWEEVVHTNLLGPIRYAKALIPLLQRSGTGAIVFLTSIDGIRGSPNLPAYSVSKGGLIPLTHVLASRFAPDGIRVNCVATGAIPQGGTGARSRASATDFDAILRLTPLARRATAQDVASAVLFLASAESAYITGTVLRVDGGRLAITPGTALNR